MGRSAKRTVEHAPFVGGHAAAVANHLHAAALVNCVLAHGELYREQAERAEILPRSLVTSPVQSLVLQLGRALLAGLLVQPAVDPLAVDAAVFDEEAGRAVLQLRAIISFLATVGT